MIQPYLFFEGHTEEALEFYKKVLGAQVQAVLRYKDSPRSSPRSRTAPCRLATRSCTRPSPWASR